MKYNKLSESFENFYTAYEKSIQNFLQNRQNSKQIIKKIFENELQEIKQINMQNQLNLKNINQLSKLLAQINNEENYLFYTKSKPNNYNGQKYIWRTEKDSKTRSRHLARDGKVYIWGENDLEPGQDFNCRCHAEFIDEDGNKIGLGRLKFDENKKPFLNELKDKEMGLEVLRENTKYGKNPITREIDSSIEKGKKTPGKYCAQYTREAIKQAGFEIGNTRHAKDYGEKLIEVGFRNVLTYEHKEEDVDENRIRAEFPKDYEARKGDVIVFQASPNHESGHMAMFDGNDWISDFIQIDAWGGNARKNAPSYKVYRSEDW